MRGSRGPGGAGGGESWGDQGKTRTGVWKGQGQEGMGAEQGGKHSPWVTSEGGRESRAAQQGDPQVQPKLALVPAHLASRAGGWQGAVLGRPACQVPHSGQEEGGRVLHKGALCGWG